MTRISRRNLLGLAAAAPLTMAAAQVRPRTAGPTIRDQDGAREEIVAP